MSFSTGRSAMFALLLVTSRAVAQPSGAAGASERSSVPVARAPISAEGVSQETARWIEDAILAGLPNAGFAALGSAPLTLEIRVTTRTTGQTDAGMRSITRAEAAVAIALRGLTGSGAVASVRLTRIGVGRDLEAAAGQALSSLAGDEPALASALSELSRQSVQAFEAGCSGLLDASRAQTEARAFDDAIAVLMGVPPGAPKCRARAQAAAATVYAQRASWQCGTALQNASASRAAGRLSEALDALRFVDPLSPCRQQVTRLIGDISGAATARQARVDAERAEELRRQWEFRSQALQAMTSIEKQRLQVIGQIAQAALAGQNGRNGRR